MSLSRDAVILEPLGGHTATVIWLHGLGADGHDFEPIVPALDLPYHHGIRFVFPHAPALPVTINGGLIMRAWYDIRDSDLRQQEDEQGIRESTAIVGRYIEQEIRSGLVSTRALLAGFSQGGAIALYCGLRYPEPLAGILALSAYLPLPECLAREAHSANQAIPLFMAHGTADTIIPLSQGLQSYRLLNELGYSVVWRDYPMPHAVCPAEIADIGAWIKARLLD